MDNGVGNDCGSGRWAGQRRAKGEKCDNCNRVNKNNKINICLDRLSKY